ncbi:glycosyltransferase family 4 protein [Pseudoruegeria sp. SK021]|uniref:glycosyltransferase family 4 protein n=1 Tax=Pseudoruegeria sp. SK021 TaxID=1933035 RepID=UPI000A225B4C|nr:glycosyltransferase family 4 protein [Pseudoruegeria sp. SK021]OSP52261.1 hypothetical protein BV911_18790 [Pseudoruegeria sp. SK021]
MRLMQICTNFLPGGIQRHVLDLTRYLRSNGHKIVLVGDDGEWAPRLPNSEYISLPLNAVSGSGGPLIARSLALCRCAIALRKEIRHFGTDLIHVHETTPALVAWLATRGLNIPIVMTYHGAAPEREKYAARIARYCATLTLSPSQTALNALIGHGLSPSRGQVVGLGIAGLPEVSSSTRETIRNSFLKPEGGILVLSLSRLHHQKGIDLMIKVASKVCEQRADVVFVVAGTGPESARSEELVSTLKLFGHFIFLGSINNVADYLYAADIYLLTSRWENLPISIVEAFRAGLPVIATECGGVKELVDNQVGDLCAVEDIQSLATAVLRHANDEPMRKQKGEKALSRSKEARFSPDAVHSSLEVIYTETLLSRKERRKC